MMARLSMIYKLMTTDYRIFTKDLYSNDLSEDNLNASLGKTIII